MSDDAVVVATTNLLAAVHHENLGRRGGPFWESLFSIGGEGAEDEDKEESMFE
jgi:hypothetical protein